jgi:transketolase
MNSLSEFINDRAIELGKLSVRMTTASGSGHPSSSLSLAHIVAVLMYHQMRYDPKNPWNIDNDRLVLSEGHAVPIIYAAMADLGAVVGKSPAEARKLKIDDVDTLREMNSVLDGHPNPAEGVHFFDAATGSLGQGLSAAAGLAIAARKQKIDKIIYAICGDGESREGQIWEAADFCVDHKILNLCAIVNCNGQAQSDYVSNQQSQAVLAAKFAAYGWCVRCIDGHNPDQIVSALAMAGKTDRPYVILAATIKGWGVGALLAHTNHGKALSPDKAKEAYADLDRKRLSLGLPVKIDAGEYRPAIPKCSGFQFAASKGKLADPDFDKLLADDGFLKTWQTKKTLASRRAYGLALRELASFNSRIIALDADVSNSTFSEYLKKSDAEKFIECKIAEQNMISTGVGLAAAGFIPFISSFGKFLARAYDQIEMAMISRANIKLVGSHIGVTLAADGPSQMGLIDMAFFRSLGDAHENGRPMAVVFNPADAVCAYKCVELAANWHGMVYIRTMRPDMPLLYAPNETFEVGGCKTLAYGSDLVIVATGYMVHVVKNLLSDLKSQGINASLIDAYSMPVNPDPILLASSKSGNKILTLEDNYIGGLASNIAEIAAATGKTKVRSLTVGVVPKSGRTPEELLQYCHLGSADIFEAIKTLLT